MATPSHKQSEAASPQSHPHYHSLVTLTNFPVFLDYENRLAKTPYNVMEWYNYLVEIDEALDECYDHVKMMAAALGSKRKQNKSITVAGRVIESYEIMEEIHSLRKCRIVVAERSLALLPGSYKLWMMHLNYLKGTCSTKVTSKSYRLSGSVNRKRYKQILSAFERSLVRMNKFPRVWLSFIEVVIETGVECNLTNIRRLWDRCLCALPVTQHSLIWDKYAKWATNCVEASMMSAIHKDENIEVREMALRILRRRCQYDPSLREDFADVCCPVNAADEIEGASAVGESDTVTKRVHLNQPGEAAKIYQELLNDPEYMSPRGTSRHELWQKLCELCSSYPNETRSAGVDFEHIIRNALDEGSGSTLFSTTDESTKKSKSFFNEVQGTLYLHLAKYHTHAGQFNKVRSVYAESIANVTTVRDFSLAFDAAVRFEEGICSAIMAQMGEDELEHASNGIDKFDSDPSLQIDLNDLMPVSDNANKSSELNWTLSRLEMLLEKRPLMLNRVLLRQNPHNVGEWLKRAELLKTLKKGNPMMALEEGCKAVKAKLAVNGSPTRVWIELANAYNESGDIDSAKKTYEKALVYKFQSADDLATIHSSHVDYLIELEEWDEALGVARRGVSNKTKLAHTTRAWVTLLDLEEALGTIQTTKAAYNNCLKSGMANVQICMNFTEFLLDKHFFEEAFSVFERSLDLFPQSDKQKHIWGEYLAKFHSRYILPFQSKDEPVPSAKLERMRELYERCVSTLPADMSCEFFLKYAKLEEAHGLIQRALNVYERLCLTAPTSKEKFNAYQLYVIVASRVLGNTKTRAIYEAAIAALEDSEASQMCIKYANLEILLGELQRARSLFVYGAQMADPRRDSTYWKNWHAFEVEHGNEETFREMLRVKRGVFTAFSTVNYNAAEMGVGSKEPKTLTDEEAFNMIAEREGIERQEDSNATAVQGFVTGNKRKASDADLNSLERQASRLREATASSLPRDRAITADEGEIDLDDGDDEDESEEIVGVATKEVPAGVFGGLSSKEENGDVTSDGKNSNVGALERLRAAAATSGN